MFQKGVYPYEYMDDWENINDTSLPEKQAFYNHLNVEYRVDAEYVNVKIVCRDFEIKNLEEYYELHVQSNILLFANVSENFRMMCLKIFEIDPAKFFSAPRLAWQTALKKAKVKLDLLTVTDILLIAEKAIKGRICHSIHSYPKVNNKYMKHYDKKKEWSYIQINKFNGWAMSLWENTFDWIEHTFNFNEDSIK